MSSLILSLLSQKISVCRLDKSFPVPFWALTSSFFSITRTEEELSIVCSTEDVPQEILCEKDWVIYKVEGPLNFALTGILASIANPLAEAKISIFAISTFDTDYILVKESCKEVSKEVLKKAGFTIRT